MAAQGAHGHECLRQVFRAEATGSRIAVEEYHLVFLASQLGIPSDVLHGRSADFACPFRGFRHAVVFTQNVVAVVLVGGGVVGHGLGREAYRAFVHEVPVDDVALFVIQTDHLVDDTQQKRRVRAGTNADPPCAQLRGRHVVAGTHVDEFGACILGVVQPVHAGMLRPSGVAAVQHNGVGVGQVIFVRPHHDVGVVAPGIQAQCLGLESPTTERLRLGVVHRATDDGEHGRRGSPAPTVADDGILPVLLVYALQLVNNVGERIVPADAFPFVLAAQFAMGSLAAAGLPVLALHGILDAVDVVHLLAQGAPAQAAALLRTVEAVLAGVVGLLAHHHAIHHIPHVQAHLVAILMAVDGHPFALPGNDAGVGCHDMRPVAFRLRVRGTAGKPESGCSCRSCCRPLQEIAPLQILAKQ